MTRSSSNSKVAVCLIGAAAALFAVGAVAAQSSEILVDFARDVQERTNMPAREGPLQAIQVHAQRDGCPGRMDSTACRNANLRTGAGELVGTASSAPETLRTGGRDVETFGRK